MNETMGIGGSEADTTVTSLLNAGILELIDGHPDDDPFSNTNYYLLVSYTGNALHTDQFFRSFFWTSIQHWCYPRLQTNPVYINVGITFYLPAK